MNAISASLLLLACLSAAPLLGEEPPLPPEAVPLLPASPLVPTQPKEAEGTITLIETTEGPARKAWRLSSPGKQDKPYRLSLSRTFSQPIAAGQVCPIPNWQSGQILPVY